MAEKELKAKMREIRLQLTQLKTKLKEFFKKMLKKREFYLIIMGITLFMLFLMILLVNLLNYDKIFTDQPYVAFLNCLVGFIFGCFLFFVISEMKSHVENTSKLQ